MKANEFIKKCGYCKADYIWRNYNSNHVITMNDGVNIYIKEIGEILESKKLIRKVGGMKRLKNKIHKYADGKFKNRLKKAIADVESCQ